MPEVTWRADRGPAPKARTGAAHTPTRARGPRALLSLALALCLAAAGFAAAPAGAVAPAPHWSVQLIPRSSHFSPEHHEDEVDILITNTGGAPSSPAEPLVIHEAFSAGVRGRFEVEDWSSREELSCPEAPGGYTCETSESIPVGGTIEGRLGIAEVPASGVVVNTLTVTGAGAPPASATLEIPISSEPVPFALEPGGFQFTATDAAGESETQAAAHPFEQSTTFELMSNPNEPSGENNHRPAKNPRTVAVTLPNGFLGNPLSAPRCSAAALADSEQGPANEALDPCPAGSAVGSVIFTDGQAETPRGTVVHRGYGYPTPVYNVVPEAGHAAEFGFTVQHQYPVVFYADLVKTAAGYRLRVSEPALPVLNINGATVTLFGRQGGPGSSAALLTNPSACQTGPLDAHLEIDSWEEPHSWLEADTVAYPRVDGCDLLGFAPEVAVNPEQTPADQTPATVQADSPDGYEVALKVPHADSAWGALSSPEIKGASLTFPPGLSVSVSSANGLQGCEATGPSGIDIPTGVNGRGERLHPDEAGEGEAIGADGLSYLTEGHCPSRSQVGQVEIVTPLLEHPITGSMFIAVPGCGAQAPCSEAQVEDGEMITGYLEAHGSGVDVKLKGAIEVGGNGARSRETGLAPGQIRARFLENPELPVSELKIKVNGGPRAPLASPQTCGTATTTAVIEPWSTAGQTAAPQTAFSVIGCPANAPFAPLFAAGSIQPLAGGSSPMTVTVSRHDGEQDLSRIIVHTPPGVSANLASVTQCAEPQIALMQCPASSLIGHDNAAAGVGSTPYWVEGTVYLTGPYEGAPFGLLIVTPAKAGPFNLGDIATRAALRVSPDTGAATVESDPLPQSVDGIPLRLKTVQVDLDRPGFMLAPTNCSQLQITGTVTGALPDGTAGAAAPVSVPYAVTGCKARPFKPSLTASTKGQTSKLNGASLTVRVAQKPGEANIRRVDLQLPKILPARNGTLHKACTEAQFDTNPAGCPEGSFIGTAAAHTPILSQPLQGPAILVSHGGAAFPDVEFVLQGEGVTVVLDGKTFIDKQGFTYSHFETVPDVPISSFETVLPQGPHSIFAAYIPSSRSHSFCSFTQTATVKKRVTITVRGHRRTITRTVRKTVPGTLSIPTTITGQNGAVLTQTTKIAITGCPKKPKHTTRKSTGKARHTHASRRA